MRDFAKVSPTFWIGKTHRKLREAGAEALVVSLYLLTSPHSHMIGLYYLPLIYIAHETGLGMEGALKGLQRAESAGFCYYDTETEMVWIPGMAHDQIGRDLKQTDKQCKGVQNAYRLLPENPYLSMFFDMYKGDYHLVQRRGSNQEIEGKSEGGSKGLEGGFKEPWKQGEGEGEGEEKEKEKEKKDPPPTPQGESVEAFDFNSLELPDWLSPEIWSQWIEFCVELGKPLKTQRGAIACVKRLDEFRQQGHTPESVILHTIANDWKTLSPPHSANQESNFIDYEGSFARLIISSKKPKNKAEEIAKTNYSNARLGLSQDTTCRIAWRGYLYQAYKQTGEQPYTGG